MDTQKIDLVAIDQEKNQVSIIVMDDCDWLDERKHIDELHEKILYYVAFVENGTFHKKYPEAIDKTLVIKVIFEHSPSEEGQVFIDQMVQVLMDTGYQLELIDYASL